MLRVLLIISVMLLAPCRWASAQLVFPEDHGPHPDRRIESWYFSGRLMGEAGQQFGFHLGFFRLGVQPDVARHSGPGISAWRFNDLYRAELGITDLKTGRFQSFERLSRAALGLAGAQSDPVRLWVNDWSLQASSNEKSDPTFRIHANWGEQAKMSLELQALKAALDPGNPQLLGSGSSPASAQWYSITRMRASGELWIEGQRIKVKGEAWLDRLWRSASFELIETSLESADPGGFLSSGQIAINRFSLQLENGWELLLFQTHRRDGTGVPVPSGMLVYEDGSSRRLSRDELTLTETGYWTSPEGVRYPAAWKIAVPGEGLTLAVKAAVADQENRGSVRYWSGAVDVTGQANDRAVAGQGHAALVGYGGRAE